ncbi:hypothetical protein WA158_006489 [Blastocystis sp. Blastoise]
MSSASVSRGNKWDLDSDSESDYRGDLADQEEQPTESKDDEIRKMILATLDTSLPLIINATNIPDNYSEEDVMKLFQEYNPESVVIAPNNEHQKIIDAAITFKTAEDLASAYGLNHYDLDGRKLELNYSVKVAKVEKPVHRENSMKQSYNNDRDNNREAKNYGDNHGNRDNRYRNNNNYGKEKNYNNYRNKNYNQDKNYNRERNYNNDGDYRKEGENRDNNNGEGRYNNDNKYRNRNRRYTKRDDEPRPEDKKLHLIQRSATTHSTEPPRNTDIFGTGAPREEHVDATEAHATEAPVTTPTETEVSPAEQTSESLYYFSLFLRFISIYIDIYLFSLSPYRHEFNDHRGYNDHYHRNNRDNRNRNGNNKPRNNGFIHAKGSKAPTTAPTETTVSRIKTNNKFSGLLMSDSDDGEDEE